MAGFHEQFMSERISDYRNSCYDILSKIIEESIDNYIRANTSQAVLDILENSNDPEGSRLTTSCFGPLRITHIAVPGFEANESMLDEKGKEALELTERMVELLSGFDGLGLGAMKRVYNAVFEGEEEKFKELYEEVM